MASNSAPIAELLNAGVLSINDGYRAKNSELSRVGIPFARAQNINNGFHFEDADCVSLADLPSIGNKISAPGDVVFTSKGTVGRFALVRDDTPRFVYAPQLCFWRSLDRRKIEPSWLYYWMHSREFFVQFKGVAGQTDMAEYVSLGDQRRMHISVPSLPEQRAIAGVLGALDDKIEVNRKQARVLEGIARAVFTSWFVNFDPVRRPAAPSSKAPFQAAPPALTLPKPLAALFPTRLVDSAIGEVPEGWRVEPMSEHFDAIRGLSYKGSGLADSGMPMHNLNSVYEGGGYKYPGIKFYSGAYRDRHMLDAGDVIVANTEQGHDHLLIGYPAIVPKRFGDKGLFSHHLYRVRPKAGSPLTARFIYQAMMTPRLRDEIIGHTNGTTVNMLSISGLEMSRVVVPPAKLVEKFDALAKAILDRIELMNDANPALAALRDALLPKLISGELPIADAEKIVGREV